jgi:hypothetical protein
MKPAVLVGVLYVLFGFTAVGHQEVSKVTGQKSSVKAERADGALPATLYVGGAAIAVGVGLVVGGTGRTE